MEAVSPSISRREPGASPARVLVVDDDEEMCRVLADGLARRGHRATYRTSADEAFALVMAGDVDVVATDIRMRGMNGIELCDRVVQNRADVPVIVMTAFGSLETAIETIRAGAFDFLTKPFDADVLVLSVERALNERHLREEVKRLRSAAGPSHPSALVGESAAMREVHALVERGAATDTTTLISG